MRKQRPSRLGGRARLPHGLLQLEPLEPRQLLSVDLSGSFINSPTQLFTGTRAVVTLNIANNGDTNFRRNLSVKFYLVPNGTDFDPNTATGGITVTRSTRIAAGGSVERTFRIPVSRNADTGDFHLVAVVDPRNRVAETDETNNVAESSGFVVTVRPVDAIPEFTVNNAVTVVSGRNTFATLRVTLTNDGTESMKSGQTVGIRVVARPVGAINSSQDIIITNSGTPINVGGLKPGDSRSAFIGVRFPSSIQPGDFNIILTADPNNKLAETNEFNNVAVLATPITVFAAQNLNSAILVTGTGATAVTTTPTGATTIVPIGGVASNTATFADNSGLGLVPTAGAFAATPTGVAVTPTFTTGFVPTSTVSTPVGVVATQPVVVRTVVTTPVVTTVPTTIITQPVGTTPISVAPTAGLSLLPQPVGAVNTVPQTVNLGLFPTSITGTSVGTTTGIVFI